MKKFIKGRWFPLTVAVIAVVIVALVMALFGWKITYAPDLENSWEAISAVAAWVGVVASLGAIMIAIWIPTEIANRQDKISLFEKRYELYDKVLYWQKVIALLLRQNNINEAYATCYQMLNKDFFASENVYQINNFLDWSKFHSDLMFDIDELKKADFLFSEKPREYVFELVAVLIDVFDVYAPTPSTDNFDPKREELRKLSERFKEDEILEKMKDDLKL